ncbi:MAG: hypothetical protein QXP53_02760 [Candidatus Pacearchaeota archaeon]
MNKKAFFFTLTILFLITLLLVVSFSYRREYTKESVKTRLLTGNALVETIEKDAERAIHISGKRVLAALNDYVTTKGAVPETANFDDIFAEALINGTLNVEPLNYAGSDSLLENSTLSDWKNKTINLSQEFGFNLTFYDIAPSIHVSQSTPWAIDLDLTIGYVLKDEQIKVTWSRSVTLKGKIPIFGLEDPLYIQEFGRNVANQIHKTNESWILDGTFVTIDGTNCNAINLTQHILASGNQTGSFYINSSGPNYLNRLKGHADAQDVGTGIESIINIPKINAPLSGVSVIDHSYINKTTATISIVGAPSWLVMTDEEADNYKIPGVCRQQIIS